jgi:hypothetical protein
VYFQVRIEKPRVLVPLHSTLTLSLSLPLHLHPSFTGRAAAPAIPLDDPRIQSLAALAAVERGEVAPEAATTPAQAPAQGELR